METPPIEIHDPGGATNNVTRELQRCIRLRPSAKLELFAIQPNIAPEAVKSSAVCSNSQGLIMPRFI
jgi:hypothetical protein